MGVRMKVHELIENLRDIDPDGESEVQIDIHLRWGSRHGLIGNVRRYSAGVVRIVEETDPNV